MNPLLRDHPRIWLAMLAGIVSFLCMPASWTLVSRVLLAWNCGVLLFLVLVWWWMVSLSALQICERYTEEDWSAPLILILVTVAALVSVVAILEPLATLRHVSGSERFAHIGLAFVTLLDSWALVPTVFTSYYADMYYSVDREHRPLRFPDTDAPVFIDFAYFSFTIAAACQTADIATAGRPIRKVVIAHEIVSLAFNTSIVGVAINVSAGLIGG